MEVLAYFILITSYVFVFVPLVGSSILDNRFSTYGEDFVEGVKFHLCLVAGCLIACAMIWAVIKIFS